MKYIIYILFFVCVDLSVKAQVPTGFPSQTWAGWIKPTYVVPDSGTVIPKNTPTFTPRFVGTTITYQQGSDTSILYWTGLRWIKLSTATAIDTTSLSNRINLKLNISDTASMLLPYLRKADTLNKWIQNVYARNDSLFKLKNGTETFIHIFPTSGSGTVTSIGVSVPAAMSVTPSTITTSGTFNLSGAGTASQYVKGNFTLGATDTSMIPNFFSKVRSEFSGTSPITYNSTTGAIGINNANTTGTKGAASFTTSFSDNGSGQIDLATLVSAGSCTGCVLNIDAKGRILSYADGPAGATNNTNIGSGIRPVNELTQQMRTYFGGFGIKIDTVANVNGTTWRVDTTRFTGLPTYFYTDSLVIPHQVDWCNLVSAGADSTGHVDASPIAQSLVNSPCKVIYIPSGNFLFNSTVHLKDSMMIVGDGKSTVIKVSGNFPALKCGWFTGGKYPTLVNFSIFGTYNQDSTAGVTAQDGILLDSALGGYINNITIYKVSGYGVHFKNTGKVYAPIANQLTNSIIDSSYGGVKADTTAEANLISGITTHACHIGLFGAGGSDRFDDCTAWYGDYGIYLTGGANNNHATVKGGTFVHNSMEGVHATGVSNGQNFEGAIIRQNVQRDIYMENSVNLWFNFCDIGTDSIVSVNCTNSGFFQNKYWNLSAVAGPPSNVSWRIVGDTPTVSGSAYVKNGFTLYDAINTKKFDIIHVNNVIDMNTTNSGKIRLNDSVVVGSILSGSEQPGGSLKLLPTSNQIIGTTGYIYLGKNSAYKDSTAPNSRPFLGIGTNVWSGYDVEVRGKNRGNFYINLHNDSTNDRAAAVVRLGQFTSTAFISLSDEAYTLAGIKPGTFSFQNNNGSGGIKFVSLVGDIEFGSSSVTNTNIWSRYRATSGDFTLKPPGAATDNGITFQDYGAMSIKKDSVPIITSPTTQMVVLIDTANNNQIERATVASIFGNTLYTGDGTANNRTVTITGSTMTFTSALTSPTPTLTVNNTSSGHGVLGNASGAGYGVYGSGFRGVYGTGTGGGTGAYGEETSGIGLRGVVTTGTALEIDHTPTSFNDIQTAMLVTRLTSGNSGNGANGIGTAIQFAAPTTTTTSASVGGALNWSWATATNASRKGSFSLQTVTNAGSLTDKLIVSDDIQLNANTYVFKRIDNTVPYTAAIIGSGTVWELGYTPTPGTYSKGSGIIIDTNNNASLGTTQIPSTAPLYATGGSTYVSGFQNQAGTFNPVATFTSGTNNIGLTYYFIQCDASGGNITLNLPAASTAFAGSIGIEYIFFRTDLSVNTVTVNRAGSDTINGATSFTIVGQYTANRLQCTSTSTWAKF